jgi:hypothetical protein
VESLFARKIKSLPSNVVGLFERRQALEPKAGSFRVLVAKHPRLHQLIILATDTLNSIPMRYRILNAYLR